MSEDAIREGERQQQQQQQRRSMLRKKRGPWIADVVAGRWGCAVELDGWGLASSSISGSLDRMAGCERCPHHQKFGGPA